MVKALEVRQRIARQREVLMGLVDELKREASYRGIERLVQLVIQALLDLGLMAISALGLRKPASYRDIATVLEEAGLLEHGDAHMLRLMAGLRNILVHAYAHVDKDMVLDASHKLVSDAPRIAGVMLEATKDVRDPRPSREVMELTERMAAKLREVLEGRVKAAFLFGGRAKGYVLRGDVDVAVFFGRPYDLYELGELVVDMADALGVDEGLIDILVLDHAPPELVLEALEGLPILPVKPLLAFELRLRALRELLDLREGLRLLGSH